MAPAPQQRAAPPASTPQRAPVAAPPSAVAPSAASPGGGKRKLNLSFSTLTKFKKF